MDDKQIAELLQQLAVKLGTTVDHLWAVLVKQSKVYFWTYLVLYLALIVGLYFARKYVIRWFKEIKRIKRETREGREKDGWKWSLEEDEMPYVMASVMTATLSAILTMIAILSLPDVISQIVNPEYWALNQILGLMKQ